MNQKIQNRLREACLKLRTSSIALSDFIPLLQQAADALDEAERLLRDKKPEDFYKWTEHQRPL